jgi:hypothetical protein
MEELIADYNFKKEVAFIKVDGQDVEVRSDRVHLVAFEP